MLAGPPAQNTHRGEGDELQLASLVGAVFKPQAPPTSTVTTTVTTTSTPGEYEYSVRRTEVRRMEAGAEKYGVRSRSRGIEKDGERAKDE